MSLTARERALLDAFHNPSARCPHLHGLPIAGPDNNRAVCVSGCYTEPWCLTDPAPITAHPDLMEAVAVEIAEQFINHGPQLPDDHPIYEWWDSRVGVEDDTAAHCEPDEKLGGDPA